MSQILRLSKEKLNLLNSSINSACVRERTRILELITGQPMMMGRTTDSLKQFCPHRAWPKQQTFIDLCAKEAFYGGAAAGGKSEALLMAALQYVHVPGYAALILRKDTQRLRLAGGLIPRSHQWLANTKATWHAGDRRWIFQTGKEPASISFGYLKNPQDKYRYGSSEYQFIAFDELTEFAEEDYLFLFSRLRKTTDISVPLRMRAASNPGNLGHTWVKNRFIGDEVQTDIAACEPKNVYWKNGVAFVPARIVDNPAVDEAEYRESLSFLPPLIRQRLMNGDWSVRQEGLIREDWFRYFTVKGQQLALHDKTDRPLATIDQRSCRRFATIDPAGTSADRARERRGRPPSWSVIQIWEQPPGELEKFLLLRHTWRGRVGFDGLCKALRDTHAEFKPNKMYIENEKLGTAAVDVLRGELPLEPIATGGRDKVTRAAPLINKLERGEVFFPRYENDWLTDLEAEFLTWTGLGEETTDQIDAAAYAVLVADFDDGNTLQLEPVYWG